MTKAPRNTRRSAGALAAGAGIFLSRIAGLVRERVFAHYLGTTPAADAFKAAMRIPNLLQNLLGEGVLSASFIPVYAKLLADGETAAANKLARTIGTLLLVLATLITALGVTFAAPLVDVLAAGFAGPTKALTVTLVRIFFPGIALLVIAAWCLGILNSHRKFFLSYAAPVLWNLAIIAACMVAGRQFAGDDAQIAIWVAWGAFAGSAAQLLIQLPSVWRLVGRLSPAFAVEDPAVSKTLRAFGPVLIGRGSVQLSAYIDGVLASYLGVGIVAATSVANTLYVLPISLFGMAISAAELPEMARLGAADPAARQAIIDRLQSALRRVVFFVVPSAVAFVAIGQFIIALLFQTGQFTHDSTHLVWIILAGSAIGLTAGTQGRLLASALYAIGDAKAPLRASLVRMALTLVAGWALVFPLRHQFGYAEVWSAFGLTASAGVAAWLEFAMLRRQLQRHVGHVPVPVGFALQLTMVAAIAGVAAYWLGRGLWQTGLPMPVGACGAIGLFGALYLGLAMVLKVPETGFLTNRMRTLVGTRRSDGR